MTNNFNVQGFLDALEQNTTQPSFNDQNNGNNKTIEKLYLSFPGNYGKYQIMPMVSTVTGQPFEYLNNTREVKVTRKSQKQDGTETTYDAWIRILPASAYKMVDSTGRIVSSLTSEEEQILAQAQQTFDALHVELGGREKDEQLRKKIAEHLRRRDYTIFHAHCMNKWNLNDMRQAEKQNFSALFVCSAKGFLQAVSDNVADTTLTNGNNPDWMNQVYNRLLSGRSGYVLFSIALNVGGKVGYSITVNHAINNAAFMEQYQISQEDAEMMQDPVESFLGWQANKEQPGKLFNAKLIQEITAEMAAELAAVRAAKSTGGDVFAAMKATSEMAAKSAVASAPMTNDPMLQQTQPMGQPMTNPGAVFGANNAPFQTPPASHVDPVSPQAGAQPMGGQPQGAPYQQPGFAQFGQAGYGANQPGFGNSPFGN
jgi:hypothetical protein